MKANDIDKISKVTSAINEVVSGLDMKVEESETEITLTIKMAKAKKTGPKNKESGG